MSQDASKESQIGKRQSPKKSKTGITVVEQGGVKSGPENDSTGCEALPPEFDFDLDYTDQRGFHWTGKFEAHVMNVSERAAAGLTRARMLAGMPLSSVDESTINLLEMQSHLAVVVDDCPKWAEDLTKIYDLGVIGAIYEEVASYEARFWGTKAR